MQARFFVALPFPYVSETILSGGSVSIMGSNNTIDNKTEAQRRDMVY